MAEQSKAKDLLLAGKVYLTIGKRQVAKAAT